MFLKNVGIVKLIVFGLAMLMIGSTITNAQITVNMPQETRLAGTYTIPIEVANLGAAGVSSGRMNLYTANPAVARITDVQAAGLTAGLELTKNPISSGEYRVSWAKATEVTGSTTLLNVVVEFLIPGTTTISSKDPNNGNAETLLLENLLGSLGAVSVDGSFEVPSFAIWIPTDLTGTLGPVQIPVNATAFSNVAAYRFILQYDNRVLNITSATTTGTLSAGQNAVVGVPVINGNTSTVTVNWANTANISGVSAPPLLYLNGTIVGRGTSALTFVPNSFVVEPLIGASSTPGTFNGSITVANNLPVFNSIEDVSKNEGELVNFTVSATDADSDVLTYTVNATTLPAGYTFVNGVFNWPTGFASFGTYTVQFTVNDGNGGIVNSSVVNITIANVNRTPSLALAPTTLAYTKNEGETLAIQLTGTDADVGVDTEVLTYSMVSTPATVAGATLSAGGAFSWPISYAQAGSYTFAFTVTDSHGALDTKTVTVTVNDVNNPPSFTVTGAAQMGNSSIVGGHLLSFTYKAVDPESDVLTYTYNITPATTGAAVDPTTGVFTWTPAANASGSYQVVVFASDGINTTPSSIATVTVTPNVAPVIAPISAQTGTENVALNFTVSATDANSDPVVYSYTVSPVIATNAPTLNAATGAFAWTPNFLQAGTYTFTISASDGIESSSVTVAVVIADENRDPVLTAVPAQLVDEMSVLSIQLAATDEDTDNTLAYSYTSIPAATGATLDPSTGLFAWTPSYLQSGAYTVTFTVTDNKGATATQTAVITVTNVNLAPTLTATPAGAISVNEGSAVTVQLTGADVNTGDVLTYSYTSTPETTGATFDATTGAFAWTPATNQAGTYTVTFTVSDGALTASLVKVITVVGINIAPTLTLTPAGDISVNEGSPVTVQLNGADVNTGTILTYSYASTPAATGATFNASTGAFAWTPVTNQAGTYTVIFTVSDGSLTASVTKVITVVGVNVAPTLALNPVGPNFSVNEGSALSVQLVGADGNNGTTLTYSYTSTPAATGATFNTATGAFAWTPVTNQSGTYNVTFSVTDGFLTTSVASVITVLNVNIAPTLALNPVGPNFSVNEGAALAVQLVGADVNSGTTLTYSYTSTPAATGATFNTATGAFAWTPVTNQAGTYNVTFAVSDGSLSTSITSVITVVGVNLAPTLTLSPVAPYTVNEGQTITITLNGADANTADVLTYSITTPTTLPTGASLTGNVFTWTPNYSQSSATPYSFTFKVADAGGLFDTKTAAITVVNVNRAPYFTVTLPENLVVTVHIAPNPVYYRFTVVAKDDDNQPLAYSLLAGAANMSITTDGAFSWNPSVDQAGKSYVVTIQVTDGSLTATTATLITASAFVVGVDDFSGVPTVFSLMQNYPNPFNPTTSIRFALPKESSVRLTVFNVLGQEVASLVNGTMAAGFHKVEFNASKLNSGMYIYRIEAGDFVSVRKMLLMK